MSTTIDNKVVEMQFNNQNFEKNVATSMNTIADLKKSLDFSKSVKSFDQLDAAAKKVDLASSLGHAVETVQMKFSALQVMAVTALANITNSAVNAGKRIVSSLTIDPIIAGFREYETQINAVQTILANTSSKGVTLNEVNAALDELNTYADKTIYNFTEMTRNIGTFTAAGVELDTSVQAIKGIANLAAVSGSTSQQASTAMYQLSQALASGTVKLMDWNSVVNAGMGGQVFQDALKETARLHGITIDKMIASEGSFRETLKDGWLSSEILTETLAKFTGDLSEAQLRQMGYTEEQIVEIVKLGNMANEAATKVKTFSQLMDTLKEAAQSGWTQSWEILIGDFEEAKELLTEVSDRIGGLIQDAANARNDLLAAGLSSGWDQILRQGIADEEAFKDVIKEVAKEHNIAVDEMINAETSFEETLKSGWLTADILGESIKRLSEKTAGLSDEQLEEMGYTRDQIKALEDLNVAVQNGEISVEDFAKKMTLASGRENLIDALRNSFEALMAAIEPIKQAFKDIFPALTGEKLYAFTEQLKEMSSHLKMSKETADLLKRTFKGLFAIFDIVRQAIVAVSKAISPLLKGTGALSTGILEVTASIGDWLVSLDKFFEATGIFDGIVQGILGLVNKICNAIKQFWTFVSETFDFSGFTIFDGLLERINERINNVGDASKNMKAGFEAAIKQMSEALTASKFVQALQWLWDAVKTIGQGIITALGAVTSGIAEKMGDVNFSGIMDILNGIISGGIGVAIWSFIKDLKRGFNEVGKIKESVIGILDSVKDCFKAYQEQIKAKTLMKIAIAIGILAAAIVAISLIDSEKLSASLGAITVLFGELMGSLAIFNKIGGLGKGTASACSAMIAMSVAVLLLASALKKIGELDPEQMGTGVAGVFALVAMLVAAARVMDRESKSITKFSGQMLIMSAGVLILVQALKSLSSLSWEELAVGGVGILGIISMLVAAARIMDRESKSITKFSGQILVMSFAVAALAGVAKLLATMDWAELGRAGAGLVVIIGLLVGAASIMDGQNKAITKFAGQMMLMSLAVGAFAGVAKLLATMQWDELARAGSGLVVIVGLLVGAASIMNGKDAVITKFAGQMILMSLAVGAFTGLAVILGNMKWEELARAGAGLVGIVSMLVAAAVIMSKNVAANASFAGQMLVMSIGIGIMAAALKQLGSLNIGQVLTALVGLAGAITILGVAAYVLAPISASMLALGASMALVGIGLLAAGAGLLAIAAGITALGAAIGVGATAIVAGLTVIVTGLAGLIPAVAEKIGEGIIAICGVIANGAPAIGEAIKAVVLTLIDVLLTCVPQIAKGFLELVVGVLAAAVEYQPQIIDYIFQFIIGLLEGVAKNLPALIQAAMDVLMAFFSGIVDAIKGVDTTTLIEGMVAVGIIAALMTALAAVSALVPGAMLGVLGVGVIIAEIALVIAAVGALAQLPGLSWLINEGGKLLEQLGVAIGSFIGGLIGGIASGITGQLAQIGTDLSQFMLSITPFIMGAKTIDSAAMDGVKALAETILLFTAGSILNGISSWLTGGSSLKDFGQELAEFGPYLKQFYESIKGVNASDLESAANAAKALSEMASNLPNSGGVSAWLSGENSLSEFADELVTFGPKLKQFAASVAGLDVDVVTNSANAAKALAEMANNLPNSGGVAEFFAGENSMSTFAAGLAEMGPSLQKYAASVTGLDANVVTNSVNAAAALSALAEGLPNSGGVAGWFSGENDLGVFATQITALGTALSEYYASVSGINVAQLSGVITALSGLVALSGMDSSGMKSLAKNLNELGKASMDSFIEAFEGSTDRAIGSVTNMLDSVKKAADGKRKELTNTFELIVTEVVDTIENQYDEFYDAGKYIVQGLANGISGNASVASKAAEKLASDIVLKLKATLKIESPSKVTRDEVGKYIVEGIAEGITSTMSAEEAAAKKASNIVGAFKDALNSLDLTSSIAQLEYELTSALNGDTATTGQQAAWKAENLERQLREQAERVNLAQSEYDITVSELGADAQASLEARKRLLQAQKTLVDIVTEYQEAQATEIQRNREAYLAYVNWMTEYSEDLSKMGFTMDEIQKAAEKDTGYNPDFVNSSMPETIKEAVANAMATVQTAYSETADSTLGSLTSNFGEYGSGYATALGQGIQNGASKASSASSSMVQNCADAIKAKQQSWIDAGTYLVDGFVQGIRDAIAEAEAAAAELAAATYAASAGVLEIASPSKKAMKLGRFFDLGFAKGLDQYSDIAISSAESVAINTIGRFTDIVAKITDAVNENMDAEPVIRPVLDLSDVENKTSRLSSMLSYSKAMSVSAGMNEVVSSPSKTGTDASGNKTSYSFTQNNYSPKALSRLDIYRQTKNQFSALKGVVNG